MAWFEAHQTMARHPKTLKLARLIKKDRRYAVGLLHDLFSWALDCAQKDGTLPGMTADDIAAALDFTGKTGLSVVDALIESGYVEKDEPGLYRVHDWYDYAGKFIDKREADRARKRQGTAQEFQRNSNGIPTEEQRNERGIPIATVPNLTVPCIEEELEDARARAREEGPKTIWEASAGLALVMNTYLDKINPTPSQTCIDTLKAYTESLSAPVVVHAIEIALDDRKGTWTYIQAILQRYEKEGLRNMEAVKRSEEDHEARKAAREAAKQSQAPPATSRRPLTAAEAAARKPKTIDWDALRGAIEKI